MIDPDPIGFFNKSLQRLQDQELHRTLTSFEGSAEKFVTIDGKRYLNLCSNNYLGLAVHPELKQAATEAVLRYGTGTGGSRLLGGSQPLHRELEAAIGAFRPLGRVLLFNTGYMANLGIVQTIAASSQGIFSDKLNHASIADGLRLSAKRFQRYRHGNLDHLESLLRRHPHPSQCYVLSETLFSMEGDFAPLDGLLEMRRKYGFSLCLDEAHSVAACPALLDRCLRESEGRLLVMGTFGKALGSFGAYVAGPEAMIEYMINTCRSFIFSTSLPPAVVAANLAALTTAHKETWRSERLAEISRFAREEFHARGIDTGRSDSHIVPVMAGTNTRAVGMAAHLRENGLFVLPVRHPTVPIGTARLRINITCEIEEDEVRGVAALLEAALRKFPASSINPAAAEYPPISDPKG